jgi:hypothetical protein
VNAPGCQFTQPLVDRSRFDGQFKKRRKHGSGVLSKSGILRPDKRKKKPKFF